VSGNLVEAAGQRGTSMSKMPRPNDQARRPRGEDLHVGDIASVTVELTEL